jgi:hypothetical protein
MSLNNILIFPAKNYIHTNYVMADSVNQIKNPFLARVAYSTLIPGTFITSAIDTLFGLGLGIAAVCTLGSQKNVVEKAHKFLRSSPKLFVRPYANFLRVINPLSAKNSAFQKPLIKKSGDGFLSNFVIRPLIGFANHCTRSDNLLKREVVSRLTYVLLAISCIATRVLDGMICIPATILSIFTFGNCNSLNNLAYRSLQVTGIIQDLFFCTIRVMHPVSTGLR